MPRKSTDVRKSKSEAGEADWYATPQGRRQTEREFDHAIRASVLVRSAGLKVARTDPKILEQVMEQAKENATRTIPFASLWRTWSVPSKSRRRLA